MRTDTAQHRVPSTTQGRPMNFQRTRIAVCISTFGVFGPLHDKAVAGGTEARATVAGTAVTALAIGPYSDAEVDIAISKPGQRHAAKVVAPILAVAVGAGRSSTISVAVFRNARTTID